MTQRTSLIRQFWRNLKHTLVVTRAKEVYVGQDANGNKFYERLAVPEKNIKLQRRVEAADGDTWNAPEVPVEWMSWLRSRRDNPPSTEEIERNYVQMIRTQHRAAELEKAREFNVRANLQSLNFKSVTERDGRENLPTTDKKSTSFPKYDEFETEPGQFRKENQKDR